MDSNATYRRGQVERAIAKIQKISWIEGDTLSAFRADLKRLIGIDRKPLAAELRSFKVRHAFVESTRPETGTDASFTAYTAFALLIAYRLAENGMTQSRVVLFLRQLRPHLESTFESLLAQDLAKLREDISSPKELQELIRRGELLDEDHADKGVYLLVRSGPNPTIPGLDKAGGPRPNNTCRHAELARHLLRLDQHGQIATVILLTNVAHQLVAVLERTEAPARGRPRSLKPTT